MRYRSFDGSYRLDDSDGNRSWYVLWDGRETERCATMQEARRAWERQIDAHIAQRVAEGADPKDFEIEHLRKHVSDLNGRITNMQKSLESKNKALDAMHWVWCSGGCEGGVHRYFDEPLSAETVKAAIRNTSRLIQWYKSRAGRDYYGEGGFNPKAGHTWLALHETWEAARARLLEPRQAPPEYAERDAKGE